MGSKRLVAEFQVKELDLPDGEEPWWRCAFCPMGLAKPTGYDTGLQMKTDLFTRSWFARRTHWKAVHPEMRWTDFKGKGPGSVTWGKRGFLQARAAAKASDRLFQMMRNPGGHSLVVIRMPDDRSDMMLCTVCGKKGDLTSHRVFTCGDTVTAKTRPLNKRGKDIERVEALLGEARETPGQGTQTGTLESTAKALRDTLNIPPRRVAKQVHDTKAILVAKGKQPHATAVCAVCKTMATDREHGQRLNKARKSRRKYVAKLREAASVASATLRKTTGELRACSRL